jgi:hypothetical protein
MGAAGERLRMSSQSLAGRQRITLCDNEVCSGVLQEICRLHGDSEALSRM